MEQSNAITQQILATFGEVEATPEFSGDRMWLTVYLTGHPAALARAVDELAGLGWTNLEDWHGGFVYPKLEIARTAEAAVAAMKAFCHVTDESGARILLVDADTSSDVSASRFISLYDAP